MHLFHPQSSQICACRQSGLVLVFGLFFVCFFCCTAFSRVPEERLSEYCLNSVSASSNLLYKVHDMFHFSSRSGKLSLGFPFLHSRLMSLLRRRNLTHRHQRSTFCLLRGSAPCSPDCCPQFVRYLLQHFDVADSLRRSCTGSDGPSPCNPVSFTPSVQRTTMRTPPARLPYLHPSSKNANPVLHLVMSSPCTGHVFCPRLRLLLRLHPKLQRSS